MGIVLATLLQIIGLVLLFSNSKDKSFEKAGMIFAVGGLIWLCILVMQ